MTRSEILDAAKTCVTGQRQQDYGNPEDNFTRIADLWNSYLGDQMRAPITPLDVALMMGLFKTARIKSGTGTDDSFIDLAGYAACGGEICAAAREKKRSFLAQQVEKVSEAVLRAFTAESTGEEDDDE